MLLTFPHSTHKLPSTIDGKKTLAVKDTPKIADGAKEPSYQVVFEDMTHKDVPLSQFEKKEGA